MIYLFVLDDSLNSQRYKTRTERLFKCCEPMQKVRVLSCTYLKEHIFCYLSFNGIVLLMCEIIMF